MGILDDYVQAINDTPNVLTDILTNLSDRGYLESQLIGWSQNEEVSQKISALISTAKDNLITLLDNGLPEFFMYGRAVENALFGNLSCPNTKIFIRRSTDREAEIKGLFEKIKEKYGEKSKIITLNKCQIINEALQNDYFIISDQKDIFWGKPSFGEAKFIYNAPWLGKRLYSKIGSLDSFRYKIKEI